MYVVTVNIDVTKINTPGSQRTLHYGGTYAEDGTDEKDAAAEALLKLSDDLRD